MEPKRENAERVMARRRIQGVLPEGGQGSKWTWIFMGTLILCLAAFFSGIRMGKALSDLKPMEKHPAKPKAYEMPMPPFYSEPKKEDGPSREAKILLPEGTEKKAEKIEPPVLSPSKVPERIARSSEKAAPAAADKREPAATSKPKYTLQVAAFNNAEDAWELVNQLKKKGYPAYQASGQAAAKGSFHRVRIGQFSTLQEAKQFAHNFEKKEKMKALITSLTGH